MAERRQRNVTHAAALQHVGGSRVDHVHSVHRDVAAASEKQRAKESVCSQAEGNKTAKPGL